MRVVAVSLISQAEVIPRNRPGGLLCFGLDFRSLKVLCKFYKNLIVINALSTPVMLNIHKFRIESLAPKFQVKGCSFKGFWRLFLIKRLLSAQRGCCQDTNEYP